MTWAGWHVRDSPEGVRTLTLSHSAKSNALNASLVDELSVLLKDTSTRHLRALLFRSDSARTFCSGFDLSTLSPMSDSPVLPDDKLSLVFRELTELKLPTVACVVGPAFGAGCELALSCDFRVAGPSARFCMPPSKLGIIYSAEGMAKVAEKVGWQFARWMFLTGREVHAEKAYEIGLIDELASSDDAAAQAAEELVKELCQRAPLALAGMKKTLSLLQKSPLDATETITLRELRRAAFSSQDFQEGRTAFLEKRRPQFRGC